MGAAKPRSSLSGVTVSHRNVISLFSGAGGLDFGFEAAGYETRAAVEWDAHCCSSLRANTEWSIFEADLASVETKELLSKTKLRAREVDVVIGGPPCQPFSRSVGWWKEPDGLLDHRAQTLSDYLRVIDEVQPRAFLLENVPGFASTRPAGALQFLLAGLAEINSRRRTNYQLSGQLLNCADYGVPQQRERYFAVASRDGAPFKFPDATHGEGTQQPHRTAWDAIGELVIDEENLDVKGKHAWLLPSIPEGENYQWHTERGGSGFTLWGYRTRYWNFLAKLAKRKPALTVQAQPGPSVGPFHWENRRLAIAELLALQTFPSHVTLKGGRTAAQKQIGNAVPSLMAEILAREISAQIFGDKQRGPVSLMPRDLSTTTPRANRTISLTRDDPRVRALLRKYAAHPGPGKGPGASERKRRSGSGLAAA